MKNNECISLQRYEIHHGKFFNNIDSKNAINKYGISTFAVRKTLRKTYINNLLSKRTFYFDNIIYKF